MASDMQVMYDLLCEAADKQERSLSMIANILLVQAGVRPAYLSPSLHTEDPRIGQLVKCIFGHKHIFTKIRVSVCVRKHKQTATCSGTSLRSIYISNNDLVTVKQMEDVMLRNGEGHVERLGTILGYRHVGFEGVNRFAEFFVGGFGIFTEIYGYAYPFAGPNDKVLLEEERSRIAGVLEPLGLTVTAQARRKTKLTNVYSLIMSNCDEARRNRNYEMLFRRKDDIAFSLGRAGFQYLKRGIESATDRESLYKFINECGAREVAHIIATVHDEERYTDPFVDELVFIDDDVEFNEILEKKTFSHMMDTQ